jgi:ATP phosphoribosyltransferase
VNGLRELSTILDSSALLIANREAVAKGRGRDSSEELVAALESVVRAARKRYLMANVPKGRLEDVRRILPGISGPTIVDVLDDEGWVAAHAVVDADAVYQTIARLKAIGAQGILVTRIERLMP